MSWKYVLAWGLVSLGAVSSAQTYLKVIGQPGRNEAGFVAHQAPTGEIFIGGSVNDSAMVQRIDDDGNVLWSRAFKPPGQYAKNIVHLASTSDGSVIGCGTGYAPTGEPVEGFHFRMDALGNVQWVRHWDDPRVYARRIMELSASEYMLFGGIFEPNTGNFSDVLTARIDAATGDVIWLSDLLDQYASIPYISDMGSVARIGDSFYAACSIFTDGSPLASRRVAMSKFNSSGQHQETNYLLYPSTQARRMVTSDIIATNDSLTMAYFGDINGASTNFSQGLIRMDTLGNVAWARDLNVGGSTMEQNMKVVAAPFGYVIAGRTMTSTPVRLFLMAVSFSGNHLWTRTYGATTQTQTITSLFASNLTNLSDGFLLTGAVDQGGGELDLLIIRTDLAGNVDCSPVTPRNAVTTLLPEFTFPCPTIETPFAAGLGSADTEIFDGFISDNCVIDFTLGNDTTLCDGLTLDPGSIPGATYEWQDGSTDQTFVVAASGTYWVRVSVDCCIATDTVEVEITALTDFSLGNDTTVCGDAGITLSAPPGTWATTWSDGSTGATLFVEGSGEYWLTLSGGDCSVSDTIAIDVVPLPTAVISGDLLSCDGTPLLLTAEVTNADAFGWNDGSTSGTIEVAASGELWIQASNQCAVVGDTVQVVVVTPITFTLGPDTLLCDGNELLLEVVLPGLTLLWSDGSSDPTVSIGEAGIYWLEVDNEGCTVRDSIEVSTLLSPSVSLGNDTTVCGGLALLLQPALVGVDDVLWSDTSTGPTLTAVADGTYGISVSNGCGTATDEISVTIVPALALAIGADTILCAGDTLLLDLSGSDFDPIWQDGSDTLVFTITEAGTYWVEATNNGCLERDTIVVDYTRLALLDLGSDTVLCEAPWLQLDAGEEGLTARWQNGYQGRYQTVTQNGVYTASITNYCGTITDSIRVSFGIPPVPLDTMDLCPGRKVKLDPGGEMLWTVWSTSDSASTITVGEGEYSYAAEDIYGCPHEDSVVVRISPERDGLIFVPNSFTPNQDGYNDVFAVVGAEEREFALTLFDRWGRELYRTTDPYQGWDGTNSGSPVPPGAYVYTVTYRDRCEASETEVTTIGHVIVVR